MLTAGTIISDTYEVQRLVHEGKLAVLVEALDLRDRRHVAIKMLHPDLAGVHGAVARSLREARALSRLQNPHVCQVYDIGIVERSVPFIVMEFLHGSDLGEMLADGEEGEPLWPATESVDLILQVCEALAEAHSMGLVHRDIKPENLFMVRTEDGRISVKVLDFGIAKSLLGNDGKLTNDGDLLGTPAYMPPEQMSSSKAVDERADIWSLGVVLYELLAGRKPFIGRNLIEYYKAVTAAPTPPIELPLPEGLMTVVGRCLQKDAQLRYRNVAQLTSALVPFAGDGDAAQATLALVRHLLAIVDMESMNQHSGAAESTERMMHSEHEHEHEPLA